MTPEGLICLRPHLLLDEPHVHAVAGELGGSKQSGGPAPMIKTSFRAIR